MKHLYPYIILLFFNISFVISAQKNPFMQFADKPYGSYHYALRDTLRTRFNHNNAAGIPLAIKQMRAVPDTKDHQWQIEADFIEANFIHDYRNGSDQKFLKDMNKLLQDSRRHNNKVFELRIIRQLFDFFVNKDIPDETEYTWLLEKMLNEVTQEEFPDVIDCKFRLGEMYLNYNDCKRAEKYFKQVVNSCFIKDVDLIFVLARNNLGLIYRNYYRDYDLSDKWFMSISKFNKEHNIQNSAYLWEAIAKGNIGKNYYYRKNYTYANSIMKESLKVMYGANDYTYSYSLALIIAQSYCALELYNKAHQYILLAEKCACKAQINFTKDEQFYLAKSKYYSGIGNAMLSHIYEDSAFMKSQQKDNRYNMNKFMLIEQKNYQIELNKEINAKKIYETRFNSILIISIIISISLFLYIILYIQKRKAYHILVQKIQLWADESKPHLVNAVPSEPKPVYFAPEKDSEENKEFLLQQICDYIELSKCYQNTELSLDSFAKKIGISRTYISNSINETGDNFKTFINKYRIRKAISILSNKKDHSMEDLALQVGFNNRQSFYNAFKTITGLSPSQFKKNMSS